MSRKKKSEPASAVAASTDSSSLARNAEAAALGASRYKDAIEQFKELLKRERRSDRYLSTM